jgi:hypothetical protein
MKNFLGLAGLALALSGCIGIIIVDDTTSKVNVTNVSFTSQFRDDQGNDVICDNRNTDVTISFKFTEQPEAFQNWKTRLYGANNNNYQLPIGQLSLRPTQSAGVDWDKATNTVTYTVGIAAGTAPLKAGIRTQAVVVTPVTIPFDSTPLGSTKLGLEVTDNIGGVGYAYRGDRIRVVDNCPTS